MNISEKKKNTDATRSKYAYLTKRAIVRRAKSAGRLAALKAMRTMGHVVTVDGGWVVKKFQDGRIEKISRILH